MTDYIENPLRLDIEKLNSISLTAWEKFIEKKKEKYFNDSYTKDRFNIYLSNGLHAGYKATWLNIYCSRFFNGSFLLFKYYEENGIEAVLRPSIDSWYEIFNRMALSMVGYGTYNFKEIEIAINKLIIELMSINEEVK